MAAEVKQCEMNDEQATDGVEGDGKSIVQDDEWSPAEFVHEPPVLTVIQPNGSFCQIDARFSVPLPPDEVYGIITDPNNRRVFKNIKEVVYRKILQDDGNRQLVEVEQLGRWRFLMFSGTFSSCVLVEQNKQEGTMIFDLIRQGLMKKFSGSWKIEPLYESQAKYYGSSPNGSTFKSHTGGEEHESARELGSWITFNQTVEPAIIPPWPLNGYVRGVTAKIINEILGDLQRECARLVALKKCAVMEKQGDGINNKM